jgi:hypothetical protein
MEIKTYGSFEELFFMKDDWDKFMLSINSEIYLSYDWCVTWWKYYGFKNKLLIVTFNDKDHFTGILPIYQDRISIGTIKFNAIKIVGTEYLPIAVSVPIEDAYIKEAIPMLLNVLDSNFKWHILHFGAICGKYDKCLLENCTSELVSGYTVKTKKHDIHTYFKIEESLDKYISKLSPRQRTKTRRVYKELLEKNIKLESLFSNKDNYIDNFEKFVKMHQGQWNSIGKPGHFVAWPRSYDFHKDMIQTQMNNGRLKLLEIMLDNVCIGYEYMYKFGSYYLWYLSARTGNVNNKIDFHRVAMGEKVKKAIDDNIKYIDGMRGKYEYKLVLGGEVLDITSIYIYRNDYISNVIVNAFRSFSWVLNNVYSKIWRSRIAPRLKCKHSAYMDLWIRSHLLSY